MRRRRTPKPPAAVPGRADVPVPASNAKSGFTIEELMDEVSKRLRARNLSDAVLLAQEAVRGRGPLVDHFCELGRVWGHLLHAPIETKRTSLRVVEGGRS